MSVEKAASWRQLLTIEDRGDIVYVEGVPLDSELYKHVEMWLDSVERRYPSDVIKNITSILAKSLREIASHKQDEFIPFGDYEILDGIARQLRDEFYDPHFKPRPYMVVLYGPPGTGKTTWARQVAKKYLFEDGVLKGLYLEVTVGDLTCKWVGVPIQTAKSILEAVKTDKYMSVLLIDEADAILVRPERAGSGFELEHMQLIAELKSQLSFVTNQYYPTMIIMTTNYKDVIVRSDPALADRVIAWLEVPPPPIEVREKIVARSLCSALRTLLGMGTPLGELTIFRAIWNNSPGFRISDKARERGWSFRWYLPTLPWSADYLIALLSAWGWNPLEPGIKLDYTFREAIRVWDPDNPIYKVYARPIATLMEMYRMYSEERGIPRSFLRIYATMKRGFEDAVRFMVKVCVDVPNLHERLKKALERGDTREANRVFNELKTLGYAPMKNETPRETCNYLNWGNKYLFKGSLGTHPLHPTVLFLNLAKYTMSRDFARMVDDVLSLVSPIVFGIRHVFAPQIMTLPLGGGDDLRFVAAMRARLDLYNKIVVRELRSGKLLEPLRIMFTEPDLDRAWRRALDAVNRMAVEDYRILLRLPLLSLKLLHPVIHARTVEEKAARLYELVRNEKEFEERMREVIEELGLEDVLEAITAMDGINFMKRIKYPDAPSDFFLSSSGYPLDIYIYELFGNSPYVPREVVEGYIPVLARIREQSILKTRSEKNNNLLVTIV